LPLLYAAPAGGARFRNRINTVIRNRTASWEACEVSAHTHGGINEWAIRFAIVAVLFAVTMVNSADRATTAIAGPVLSKDRDFPAMQMGFNFLAIGCPMRSVSFQPASIKFSGNGLDGLAP
jgi:hypothetical protein